MSTMFPHELSSLFQNAGGILRSSELHHLGIDSRKVKSLVDHGQLICLKDGYYTCAESINDLSDHLVAVSTIPNAIICFISAASIYGMTTVIPDSVYLAVRNTGRYPNKPSFPPINLTAYKPAIYELGKTSLTVDQWTYPIYDRERTVCDCFKRSQEIGDDVAMEVLKSYMREKKDIPRLFTYAQKMCVLNRIQPYVEALL